MKGQSKYLRTAVILALLTAPIITFAAPTTFKGLVGIFIFYVQAVVPVVMGLTILYFFWGIVKFIFAAGDETKRKDAKNVMTWGLLALFFMFSVLAIVGIAGNYIFPNFSAQNQIQGGTYYYTPNSAPVTNEQMIDLINKNAQN